MDLYYIANVRFPTEKAHGYQICKMCEAFSSLGVRVRLVALRREGLPSQDIFKLYDLNSRFDFKIIKTLDYFKFFKLLGKLSYWLQSLEFSIKLFFLDVPKEAIIYSRSPEIIWLFNLRGLKTVLELHSWPKSKKFLFKFLIKKASKINVLTKKLKELCLDAGVREEDCCVIPDAVDLKRFDINCETNEAREKLFLPLNKKIIGFFGSFKTLGVEKGILSIIESLKILSDGKNELIFLAVGGKDEDILFYEKEAQKNNVVEEVIFKNRAPHAQLALYQKACDVLLMPFPYNQHYAFYMSPLKMFEYMASKRPIVASDLPSIREILDEESCLFCKPDDPTDLARVIKIALSDQNLSHKISLKAYDLVQEYTWEKRAEKIIKLTELGV